MNNIKAVIFDVGGTLLNNINFNIENGFKYLKTLFYVNDDLFEEHCRKFYLPFLSRDSSETELSFSSFFNCIKFCYKPKRKLNIKKVELKFRKHVYQNELINGVKELLEKLRTKNIELYVLSNSMFSSSEIKKELKEFKIDYYFKKIVSSGDHLFRKPSSVLFDMYIDKINKPASSICFIGNDFEKDIIPAIKSSMQAVFYNPNNISINNKNSIIIDNYLNLINIWEL